MQWASGATFLRLDEGSLALRFGPMESQSSKSRFVAESFAEPPMSVVATVSSTVSSQGSELVAGIAHGGDAGARRTAVLHVGVALDAVVRGSGSDEKPTVDPLGSRLRCGVGRDRGGCRLLWWGC